ncbi:SH3 domain-containing protein [Tessaracoccus caeni]|uniref:SH3 domain-containing protein n=1 Tax=Tessaracoccus caeni TaxID=3031239 RepID=UPI0023DA1723|nr:SH3 domain-containing protein [Tessaracoccus caeni]MDF1490098.1 SH3 domain-containing protein [Tessaracoccus caeni]
MQPRRAAEPDDLVEEILPATTPRRAQTARIRTVVVPLALVAVSGLLGAALVLPNVANRAEPLEQATQSSSDASAYNLSRSSQREGLSPALVTPSITPSPSASALPSATPTTSASASPSASPSETTKAKKEEKKDDEKKTEEKESSTPSPSATAKLPKLGDDKETLYVTSAVYVRKGPDKDYDSITTLSAGAKVTATDVTEDGWQQINRNGKAAWVRDTFLTDEKPEKKASNSGGSGGSVNKDASCSKASSKLLSNLTERTRGVLNAVCAEFPNVSSYGGYRAGDSGYHGSGQAIDVMISGEAGWDIARWARSNAKELGVVEVIYEQKIWTTQRSGDGWRSMSDRGSTSANHYDHVHLSVR